MTTSANPHGQGWMSTTRWLAIPSLAAACAYWVLGHRDYAVLAILAGGVLATGPAILARRARRRGARIDLLTPYLSSPPIKGILTLRKPPRWRGDHVIRIDLAYSPELDDANPEIRRLIEQRLTHKLEGRYTATWHTRDGWVRFQRHTDAAAPQVEEPVTPPLTRLEQVINTRFPSGTALINHQYDDNGGLTEFDVKYPAMPRDTSPSFRQNVANELNLKVPGGPFKVTWDLHRDLAHVERIEPLPAMAPYPLLEVMAYLLRGLLPVGLTEGGSYAAWNTDRDTGTPHALLAGTSGSGKTSLMRAIVVGALLLHWRVLICDPKVFEFAGLADFPGVEAVASKPRTWAEIVYAVYLEMLRRNRLIARAKRARKPRPFFEPILLIVDEFIDFKERLDNDWNDRKAADKSIKGRRHFVLTMLNLLGVKSRAVDIHLLFGAQRPDADFVMGALRDQMRFRVSLMSLDQHGNKMMWDGGTATPLPNIKGRANSTDALGQPKETQGFWVPDPGNYHELSEEERAFIDEVSRLAAEGIEDRAPLVILADDDEDDDDVDDEFGVYFGTAARSRVVYDEADAPDDVDLPLPEPIGDLVDVDAADLDAGMRVRVEAHDGTWESAEIVQVDEVNGGIRIQVEYVTENGEIEVVEVEHDDVWQAYGVEALQPA